MNHTHLGCLDMPKMFIILLLYAVTIGPSFSLQTTKTLHLDETLFLDAAKAGFETSSIQSQRPWVLHSWVSTWKLFATFGSCNFRIYDSWTTPAGQQAWKQKLVSICYPHKLSGTCPTACGVGCTVVELAVSYIDTQNTSEQRLRDDIRHVFSCISTIKSIWPILAFPWDFWVAVQRKCLGGFFCGPDRYWNAFDCAIVGLSVFELVVEITMSIAFTAPGFQS